MSYLREACVETPAQALAAQNQGADRLEYCADLSVGGITPPWREVERILADIRIPVRFMLRPRGGNFFYNSAERAALLAQARQYASLGAGHIVTGALAPDGRLDLSLIQELLNIQPSWGVTIHKVIDESADPVGDAERLAALPAQLSLLSSGGAPTAFEGLPQLRRLLAAAAVELVACGKVTHSNLPELHAQLGAPAYHGRLIVGPLPA
jgi:copper homeostasis protein